MKKILALITLAVVLVGVSYSCQKAVAPTAFSFTIDGTEIVADSTQAYLYTYTGSSISRRQIQIRAFKDGKQVLEILALAKLGAQPALTDCFISYFFNGGYNSSDVYMSEAGGVNFTTCDTLQNLIQGTFSVENAVNTDTVSKIITNGKIYIDKIYR